MGLSRKKPDPISERARDLNSQIAALEEQIRRLNEQAAVNEQAAGQEDAEKPRLRSTARPHHQTPPAVGTTPHPTEPIFEEFGHPPLRRPDQTPPKPESVRELGVRKPGGTGFFKRVKNQFRPPPASNPKLVSYLAAGSIQGLRPLRYEKRVARNRFIFLVVALLLLLWGIIAVLVKY
jgi:outer membrane murein-binding lipoprotein Lpp